MTHRLIERRDRIVVAVSGGPDSVALLAVLQALAPLWNLSLWVVHFNYGLRGAESDEDAAFVMRLCESLNVPGRCEPLHLTEDLCKGRSLQEAAREARYAALLQLQGMVGANKVALGHTRDDQAETVLMRLLRGAGATGLSGMPTVRAPFIRPLLATTRPEILCYLKEQGLEFREDSSNATPLYLRNRIRHHLLPLLTQYNPAIAEVLTRQGEILREDDACLDALAADHFSRMAHDVEDNQCVLTRSALLAVPLALQRRVIRKAMQRVTRLHRGPSFMTVSLILARVVHGCTGSCVTSERVGVSREYDKIRFQRSGLMSDAMEEASGVEVRLPVPATLAWPLTGQRLQADLVHCLACEKDVMTLPPTQAMVDADRVTLDLRVRVWRAGDRFHPFGMGGHRKKLQDFFADVKVPRSMRARVPLVVAPEGIVWISGYRTDDRFRVTGSTRRILRLRLVESERRELV